MLTAGLSHFPRVRIREFLYGEADSPRREKSVAHCLPDPYCEGKLTIPQDLPTRHTQFYGSHRNGPPGIIQQKRESFNTKKTGIIENQKSQTETIQRPKEIFRENHNYYSES